MSNTINTHAIVANVMAVAGSSEATFVGGRDVPRNITSVRIMCAYVGMCAGQEQHNPNDNSDGNHFFKHPEIRFILFNDNTRQPLIHFRLLNKENGSRVYRPIICIRIPCR